MNDYTSGHRQRLKQKYLAGSGNLVYDYEALELLLTYAVPRADVKPAAKALIEKFGTIDNVFSAEPAELETVPGIGQNSAILISLVRDLQKRCSKSKNSKITCLGSADVAEDYFMNLLGNENVEKFVMVTLDNSNKIISCRNLASGSTKHLKVYSRDVVQFALLDKASRVLISHNHPVGNTAPSASDIDFTLELRNTLNAVDIELADHIIVGKDNAKSMRSCHVYRNYFIKS